MPGDSRRSASANAGDAGPTRPGRHILSAADYRAAMRERLATWRDVAELRAA